MPDRYKQQVISFFNRRTAYDCEGDSHPKEAQQLLNYVSVESGQTILDIATGTGLIAISAAEDVAPEGSVIGVDISPGMLAQAENKMVDRGISNLELIEADIESINFETQQFDIIFCCSALVYISDIAALLNKCHNWLKPGGCFTFTTPNKTSHLADVRVKLCQDLFDIDLPHIIRPLWTAEKCRQLLTQNGFQNIEIERYQYSKLKLGKNHASAQIEAEFYPRGNPLENLSEVQKEQLQAAYRQAVEKLVAQEEWQENINLFVKAYK